MVSSIVCQKCKRNIVGEVYVFDEQLLPVHKDCTKAQIECMMKELVVVKEKSYFLWTDIKGEQTDLEKWIK